MDQIDEPLNRFIILLYTPDGIKRYEAEAETYWDAVTQLAPGNDCSKVEIIIA